jgi:hypothetical protein
MSSWCSIARHTADLFINLATLAAQFFLAATGWAAVLAVTLTRRFGATSLVLNTSQCGLTTYSHYRSSGGLIATKQ